MLKNKFNFANEIVKDREKIIVTSLLTSLEVLKENFGFNQDQLNKFTDLYTPTLGKNLKGGKK